ncbi:MAG: HAMP domain-containing protein [Desulfobacterales bacterium]|nr:HAMP domain-containing protein [Desulfobacterales bacterium]
MKKLRTRIIIPFLLLFLMIGLISILIEQSYISGLIDSRISSQAERISQVLSNSEFVLNPIYLLKLKEIIDGEIVVFDKKEKVIVSTVSKEKLFEYKQKINIQDLFLLLDRGKRNVSRQVLTNEHDSYLITTRLLIVPANPRERMMLCIVSPLADVFSAKAKIRNRMFLIGICGLILAGLFSYIISRSVTNPINDIVAVTRDIAEGHFEKKVIVSSVEELKLLTVSINSMTDKLKKYKTQIVRSSHLAAVGKVTAAIAHEIGNPLSSIKMMAQLLRNRLASNSENRSIIHSLLEEISRLERIVKELNQSVKSFELTLNKMNLNEIIDEVLAVITPKLAHRNIDLTTELKHSLPLVKIDRDKIKQVIWNLLLNAMESMPQGGTIKILTDEKPISNTLEIIIEDEGYGLSDDSLKKIFSPFFTTKEEGLGLGLSTSREIIKRHGGSLSIENLAEKGARAVIVLPIKS